MSSETPAFVELSLGSSRNKINRYSATERKAHYEEWRKSGLSMNEYCRRSGLLISTFSLWVKKYNKKEVTGVEMEIEKQTPNKNHPDLEIILLSGIRLRFREVANIAEILRLIKALESCN